MVNVCSHSCLYFICKCYRALNFISSGWIQLVSPSVCPRWPITTEWRHVFQNSCEWETSVIISSLCRCSVCLLGRSSAVRPGPGFGALRWIHSQFWCFLTFAASTLYSLDDISQVKVFNFKRTSSPWWSHTFECKYDIFRADCKVGFTHQCFCNAAVEGLWWLSFAMPLALTQY